MTNIRVLTSLLSTVKSLQFWRHSCSSLSDTKSLMWLRADVQNMEYIISPLIALVIFQEDHFWEFSFIKKKQAVRCLAKRATENPTKTLKFPLHSGGNPTYSLLPPNHASWSTPTQNMELIKLCHLFAPFHVHFCLYKKSHHTKEQPISTTCLTTTQENQHSRRNSTKDWRRGLSTEKGISSSTKLIDKTDFICLYTDHCTFLKDYCLLSILSLYWVVKEGLE